MELAFAAFIVIAIAVCSAAVVIGVPMVIGLVAYDAIQSNKERKTESAPVRADDPTSIAVKRGVARAFVVVGALYWSAATFAQLYSGGQSGAGQAIMAALIPLGASLVTLVIGWYWERFTAAALMFAAIAVVAWGVVYQFEAQVWLITLVMLVGPMVTASVLFWLARRSQEAYEFATSLPPKLAFAFAAHSTLDS